MVEETYINWVDVFITFFIFGAIILSAILLVRWIIKKRTI